MMISFSYRKTSATENTAAVLLACAPKESYDNSNGPLRAFRLIPQIRPEGSPLTYLPLVVMDTSKRVSIDVSEIVDQVVVLRESHYSSTVSYFEGMVDVYAIKQKKLNNILVDIGEGEFDVFQDHRRVNTWCLSVSWYLVRTRVTAAIHRAILKSKGGTNVRSDYLSLGRIDFQRMVATLEAEEIPTKSEKQEARYNIELGGCVVTESVCAARVTYNIKSVDAFEQLFGYLSSLRYMCNMNVPSYQSMETTKGYAICKTVDRKFAKMLLQYDSCREQCRFIFTISEQNHDKMVEYLNDSRANFYASWMNNLQFQATSTNNSANDSIRHDTTYGHMIDSADREYIVSRQTVSSYNNQILERAVMQRTGSTCVAWHKDLLYVMKNVYLRRAESVYLGVIGCFNDTRTLNADAILEELKVTAERTTKKRKIELIAQTLETCYINQVEENF